MLKKLTDRIFYLPYERDNDRPNLYYINGDNYSVAIDAGNSEEHVKLFYSEIEKSGLRKPSITIITHWHWDHTFGIHAVDTLTIASKLTNDKLKEVMKWKWTPEDMSKRLQTGEDIEFCDTCIKVEYKDLNKIIVKPVDIEVENKLTLNLGGVECFIEHRDAPHTRDSLFVYIPKQDAMVIADADCEDYYDNNGEYDIEKLKSYMEFIKSVDFKHYLISHDLPITKDEAIEYLQEQLDNLSK